MLYFLPVFTCLAFFISNAAASVKYYPTDKWLYSTPEEQGMASTSLLEMMMEIKKNGYQIQSITIVRNGYLVLDAYINYFQDGQKHETYSVTKSVISILIGIAIDKGHIKDVDQTIIQLFPNKKIGNLSKAKRLITLKDLLMMASGLDCNSGSANKLAGTIAMRKSDDWTQYNLNLPMAQMPGEHFDYCNGVSHLLSAIIHESTGMQTLDFAKKHLFNPLGIKDVEWEESPKSINNGFMGLRLQPRDMAKIGLLCLNKGKWENNQIVSAEWIEESTQPYIDGKWNGEGYGYQWWINPAGYYSAVGNLGQAIHVIPGLDIVAVFTGNIEGRNMHVSGRLLQNHIIPASISSESLPANPHEKKRLDDHISSIANTPAKGTIWLTEKEGVAKDGMFKRTASPGFQFKYPLSSIKTATRLPDQIMRMQTLAGGIITASTDSIPRDWRRLYFSMKLKDFGPKAYASWIKEYGSNITVLSNEEIMLSCGTKAYRTNIKWLVNNQNPLITNLVATYKDKRSIYIAVHEFKESTTVEKIIESLRFE